MINVDIQREVNAVIAAAFPIHANGGEGIERHFRNFEKKFESGTMRQF